MNPQNGFVKCISETMFLIIKGGGGGREGTRGEGGQEKQNASYM